MLTAYNIKLRQQAIRNAQKENERIDRLNAINRGDELPRWVQVFFVLLGIAYCYFITT